MLCYVHVPFCVSKCRYCAFHSIPFSSDDASFFVHLVKAEIIQWSKVLGAKHFDTVYFGGGTPSLLKPQQIAEIVSTLEKHFTIAQGAEITLEANPESIIQPGLLADLHALGINRLSLGLQSMSDTTLKVLGRPHTAKESRQAVHLARDVGFTNVSLDAIWGVPGQTLHNWAEDLQDIIALEPDHLSAYALTLEEGTVLARQAEDNLWLMPTDEAMAEMYIHTVERCQAAGLAHYEVSNFAHPGKESRHNYGYWTGIDYLGLGPSAVSTIKNHRWTNPCPLVAYEQVIQNNKKRQEENLSQKTRDYEEIMLALRTTKGVGFEKLFPQKPIRPDCEMFHILTRLQDQGLIRLQSDSLSLTSSGMLVSNSIIELVLETMDHQHADTRLS